MRQWVSVPSTAGTPTVSPGEEEAKRLASVQPAEPSQEAQSDDDIGWPKQ